ncbi:hypothetical protein [Algoriphagus winogradskyi]|uniref:Addiction module component n=1 Tax=Algoriphagus winogradskyi TaxID=237017 RepID=A0ABY1NEA1_9BACT|nr:hypothetical protein [Algoriphagus winogradskyi]SMP07540.1 hypothetical protein SAMN06265367_101613 [Algoriphagus winogradskyi]
MDVSERIKKNLISRIKETQDIDLLKDIESIFDSKSDEVVDLTEDQLRAIETGRNQIKNGQFKAHQQVISEMKKRLESK